MTGLVANRIVNKSGLLSAENLGKLTDAESKQVNRALTNAYAGMLENEGYRNVEAYRKQAEKTNANKKSAVAHALAVGAELSQAIKNKIGQVGEKAGTEKSSELMTPNQEISRNGKDINETVLKTETAANEENTSGNSDLQVFKKNNKMETQESYLRSDADPIRLTLGRASDSHPAELNNIRVHCDDIGVEIKERAGTMAYSPNPSPGKPGTLIIDQDASISAWRHEYQHVLDDYAMGWGGFRIFENRDACWKMEEDAYNIELKLAQELDDSNAIEILQKYKDMRKKEIYGEE